MADLINIELTYSVNFNLALQFQNNGLFNEALNQYTTIVKNKAFQWGGRARVNMGNIYF